MVDAPAGNGLRFMAGGDSLVAHRGVVGLGTDMLPVFQAGIDEHNARHGSAFLTVHPTSTGPDAGRDNG